ncbi:hypothetical protein PMAC_003206 [Pneumocystis sp. 'macacae']|nr:hypothetical protein PMAC_003206 [Pneumocystis sp. 'macacae']
MLIYLATEKNILAAINSEDGSLVWRQEFAENDPINIIKPLNSKIITFSNSSILRAWNALTGFLIWEKTFLSPFSVNRYDINFFENNITSNNDIIVLTSNIVCSLNSDTGSQIWSYSQKPKMSPLFLSISNSFIYLIESKVSSNIYSFSVSKLNGRTGDIVTSNYLSSISKLEDIIYTANLPLPIIAWKNSNINNSVYIHMFDTNITHIINTESSFDSVKFYLSDYFNTSPSILLHFISNSTRRSWASIFLFNSNSSILKLYEISSISIMSNFFSTNYMSNTFFIHSFINKLGSISINIYSDKNNSILGTWDIFQNRSYNSYLEQTVSKILKITDKSIIIKSIIVTQDALVYMIQGSSILWTRDESLAYSIHAEFLELPQKQVILSKDDIKKERKLLLFTYINRIVGHINKLKRIQEYLHLLKKKFIKISKNTKVKKIIPKKDIFDFRKIIIIITSKGKILALDSFCSDTVLWSNQLGDKFNYKGLWIIKKSKTLSDSPIIAVLGMSFENMYFWRINGLTGKILSLKKVNNNIKSFFILDHDLTKNFDEKIIVAITDNKKVILLYDTSKKIPISELKNLSNIYFSTKNSNTLEGYFINFKNLYANITWSIDFPSPQFIISVSSKNKNEKIASIGRVLGNRSVLYKYLNPHLLVVTTGDRINLKLDIYLIDIVKGMILYTDHYNNVDISKGVKILLAENWLVYQFWIENPTKGYQIVISELYENKEKNKKNKETNLTSINNVPLPFVISQAYLYPRKIQALASVLTRHGITSHDVISYVDSNKIIMIPKKLLDPRRPVLINNKMSSESIEEGLIPYDVNLFKDSEIVISHKNEIYGIKNILSGSTLLESTSIILAYGHDIFFTYVTPSNSFDILNPNFNKTQLLLTIFTLIVGLFLLRSMIKTKLLKKRWKVS